MSLDTLNLASREDALTWLHGLYEHSPWVAEAVVDRRPFASAAQLKHAMAQTVRDAGIEPWMSRACAARQDWAADHRAAAEREALDDLLDTMLAAVARGASPAVYFAWISALARCPARSPTPRGCARRAPPRAPSVPTPARPRPRPTPVQRGRARRGGTHPG